MQISVESTSPIERRMTIDVPSATVESEVNKRLQKAAGSAKINGFRPGKVPMSVIKGRFEPSVRQEVVGEVMRDSYIAALQKESINPAGHPKFEPLNLKSGEDLKFVAVFEVYPEIEIKNLDKISLQRETTEVSDADIDTMIETLRKQSANWETKKGPAEDGDRVIIDYKGIVDGEAFEGGTAEKQEIIIGAKRMIPGFEEGLIGLSEGDEKTLELQFPEAYHAENLKGKAAQFEVKVHTVESQQLAEVNDEFFAQYGVSEGGEEAFRAEVKRNMQREGDQAIENRLKNSIVHQLIEHNEFAVPSALVNQEIDRLREDAVQRFGGGGQIQASQLPAELFKDQAEKRVKTGLIFAQIVKDQGIKASDDLVDEKITNMAASYQEPEEFIKYYKSNAEQRAQVESVVMEDLVVKHIMDNAKVEDAQVSYQEAIRKDEPARGKADESADSPTEAASED
ncbi:trigger factor [Allohahella sp. A8]|uniref:trigger factor n=1 Tax=Allohahella sp. A8 TaxID=3141461 RepID=UPI003A80083D